MEPFRQNNEAGDGSLLLLDDWRRLYGLTAGFTTRLAGNVALHVGDDPKKVVENRRKVAERLGWSFDTWTCAEQVHGNRVHVVGKTERGSGRYDRESAIASTDALVTDEPDVLLAMFFADCVPLYFYDPTTGALGLAHAGWKGTVAEIAVHTVEAMSDTYGVKPENVRAAIGPSIGRDRYEVDETVLRQVRPLLESLPQGSEFPLIPTADGSRALLDLKDLNRRIMIKAGIVPSNIEISSWCTASRTDLLYSHRMESAGAGRTMSWLGKPGKL